jgi:hypothetical protein
VILKNDDTKDNLDEVKRALDAANKAEFLGNKKLADMAMEQMRVAQEREVLAAKKKEAENGQQQNS